MESRAPNQAEGLTHQNPDSGHDDAGRLLLLFLLVPVEAGASFAVLVQPLDAGCWGVSGGGVVTVGAGYR